MELTNTNPFELVRQAQKGSNDALAALYERYRLSVFRYLYYRVGDQQVAEDLTADVFLRMIRSISDFFPRNVSFQAWLFQIARNLAIDHYRKNGTRDQVVLEETLKSGSDDPMTTVEKILTSERLNLALSRLPEEQRDVIVLRFVAGMPLAQTAQTLHRSEDSIKGLQRRGLITLRDILTKMEVSYA